MKISSRKQKHGGSTIYTNLHTEPQLVQGERYNLTLVALQCSSASKGVGEAVLEIAKLGGYCQSHAPPDVKVIWKGRYARQFLTMGALSLYLKKICDKISSQGKERFGEAKTGSGQG